MANVLRRGFKADAERLALELRRELRLNVYDRLEPRTLAEHFGLPVVALQELQAWGASPASIRHFIHGNGRGDFSAATVFCGRARIILANPAHSQGRRANSIVHEVSHVALEHEPSTALAFGGCRRWDARAEEEADWLAATLLVPREAALRVVRQGIDTATAAEHFGVSVRLLEWRLNHTGARTQVAREQGVRTARLPYRRR
jgi:hypothetical protein